MTCQDIGLCDYSLSFIDSLKEIGIISLLNGFRVCTPMHNFIYCPNFHSGSACNEKYKYAFLAGFPRQRNLNDFGYRVKSIDQKAVVQFINTNGPKVLLKYLCNPISFFDCEAFKKDILALSITCQAFPELIVGLDLMGDELGYPFIPFALPCFQEFISEHSLGVRIHSGENPLYSSDPYQGLPVHMAILTLGLMKLGQFIPDRKLRIGHGTGWISMIALAEKTDAEASQLALPQFLKQAMEYIRTIPCEINITSNEYLLHSGHIQYTTPTPTSPTLV